ncbi:hypothetical protein HDU89_001089 [Geranomyces variabilis]|nr:hypothetical protein HDU89_001089 [Geranomyces variabilis]
MLTASRTFLLATRTLNVSRPMSTAVKSLYKTSAIASGKGRQGSVKHPETGFSSNLALPKSMGGPGNTSESLNPEILFSAGYASCFLGAVHAVAGAKKVKLPADTSVEAEIELKKGDNFDLAAVITLTAKGVDKKALEDVLAAAHETCPYSRATRGNIDVKVKAVN